MTYIAFNKLCIYPPDEYREQALCGLRILRDCHYRAGGTSANLNAGREGLILELFGTDEVVESTMERGEDLYKISRAWKQKLSARTDFLIEKWEGMLR